MALFGNVCRGRLLRRQLDLIALMRSCGWLSLARLSEKTGVSTRTIRRDLAALEEAHFPVIDYKDEDGERRWKMQRGAPCPLCGRDTIRGAELRRELAAIAAVSRN